jgi:hypothetical protein
MGDLSDFEKGKIVSAHLAGSSATKTATLLRVLRGAVSNDLSAYMNHGKTTSGEEVQWAKIDNDRNRSSYIEKDCFEKSPNYCSAGDRTTELDIHLEDPIFIKIVRRELHKSNIHGRAAIAQPLITESSAQMRK